MNSASPGRARVGFSKHGRGINQHTRERTRVQKGSGGSVRSVCYVKINLWCIMNISPAQVLPLILINQDYKIHTLWHNICFICIVAFWVLVTFFSDVNSTFPSAPHRPPTRHLKTRRNLMAAGNCWLDKYLLNYKCSNFQKIFHPTYRVLIVKLDLSGIQNMCQKFKEHNKI